MKFSIGAAGAVPAVANAIFAATNYFDFIVFMMGA
jgi:hypothetical protein